MRMTLKVKYEIEIVEHFDNEEHKDFIEKFKATDEETIIKKLKGVMEKTIADGGGFEEAKVNVKDWRFNNEQ